MAPLTQRESLSSLEMAPISSVSSLRSLEITPLTSSESLRSLDMADLTQQGKQSSLEITNNIDESMSPSHKLFPGILNIEPASDQNNLNIQTTNVESNNPHQTDVEYTKTYSSSNKNSIYTELPSTPSDQDHNSNFINSQLETDHQFRNIGSENDKMANDLRSGIQGLDISNTKLEGLVGTDYIFGTQPRNRDAIVEYVNANIKPEVSANSHINIDSSETNTRFRNSFLGRINRKSRMDRIQSIGNLNEDGILSPAVEVIPYNPRPLDFLFELALSKLASQSLSIPATLASKLSSIPSLSAEEVKRRPNCRFMCVFYQETPSVNETNDNWPSFSKSTEILSENQKPSSSRPFVKKLSNDINEQSNPLFQPEVPEHKQVHSFHQPSLSDSQPPHSSVQSSRSFIQTSRLFTRNPTVELKLNKSPENSEPSLNFFKPLPRRTNPRNFEISKNPDILQSSETKLDDKSLRTFSFNRKGQ